jgi:hypothetical protein
MRNIAYEVIDRLFIVVYGVKDPSDEEWEAYLKLVQRHGIDRTMQLIFTEGGGPTAQQRRYLENILNGRAVPVAVITTSPAIRVMVTAMSWLNRKIRAFPPTGLADALAYLEVPQSRMELIEREMAKLHRSIGGDVRATA